MSYEICLLHYFLSSDSTSFNKKRPKKKKKKENFKQKETKLVLYGIMFRVVPLGLALLYSYYPLTF